MTSVPSTWTLHKKIHNTAEKESKNAFTEEVVKFSSTLVGTEDANDEFFNPPSVYTGVKHLVNK